MIPHIKRFKHTRACFVAAVLLIVPAAGTAQLLEEIIVTATKREESLQDIPISLVAISGTEIHNNITRDMQQLSVQVPNLSISRGLVTDNVHIRGIGSGNERTIEQAVAMFIDDIYMPRSRQYRAPFLDIERVEVARGPQALLFGMNATAGAIAVHTARSRPGDKFFADITGEYESEFGGAGVTAIVGGSPGETIGLRLAARTFDSGDGYWTNTVTGSDENSLEDTLIRGSIVWEPSELATLHAKVEVSDFHRDGFLDELFTTAGRFSDGVDELNWVRGQDGGQLPLFPEPVVPGFEGELLNAVVSLDYRVGSGTVTGIVGHSDYDWEFYGDVDSTPLEILDSGLIEQYEQSSIEIRYLSSADRRAQVLVGGYFVTNDIVNDQRNLLAGTTLLAPLGFPVPGFDAGRLWSNSTNEQQEDVYSAFGEVTYDVSEAVRLRGGVRYVHSDKNFLRGTDCRVRRSNGIYDQLDVAGNANDFLLALSGFCPTVIDPPDRSRSTDNVMPEIGVQWTPNERTMLYAKASTSAKSGGFVGSTVIVPEYFEYDDETAVGYEVGLKTGFEDGAATLNVALFHSTYDDLQLNSFDPDTAANTVRNAGEARNLGIEADMNWAVSEHLTTRLSLAWLDTEFTSFTEAPCYPGEPVNPDGFSCDKTGSKLPFAPEFAGSLGADLDVPVSSAVRLMSGIYISYSTEYFTNPALDPIAVQDSYSKIDARIGVAGVHDRWSLSVIGKNVTDEVVNDFTEALFGVYRGYIHAPRTVWLQAHYRFE